MNFKQYAVGIGLLACALIKPALGLVSSFTLIHEGSSNNTLSGICKGPAGLIACGANGTILQSVDGLSWTRRNAQTSTALFAATYGNGRYIAVGDAGLILSSPDGVSWGQVGSGVTMKRLNQVAYGHGHFVAVGDLNTALYSADGITWSLESIPQPAGGPSIDPIGPGWLRALATTCLRGTDDYHPWAYTGNTPSAEEWFTAGENGLFYRSTDGVNWTSVPAGASSQQIQTISFSNDSTGLAAGALFDQETFFVTGIGYPDILLKATTLSDITPGRPSLGTSVTFKTETDSFDTTFRASAINDQAPPLNDLIDTVYIAAGADGTYYLKNSDSLGNTTTAVAQLSPSRPINGAIFYHHRCFLVGENESIYESNETGTTQLANISSRGYVSTGEKVMIAGTIITGNAPKKMLIRGIGPSLAGEHISNPLPDPEIEIYDHSGNLIKTAGAWAKSSEAQTVKDAMAQFGASLSEDQLDAATVVTLDPGAYTFMVKSISGQSGIALVDAFDLDSGTNTANRLANVSTRAFVGPGEQTLIAGLIIDGDESKRVLLRGIGPLLANSGVQQTLTDPVLTIFDSQGNVLVSNDNWATVTTGEYVYGRNVSAAEISTLMKTQNITSLDTSPNEAALVVKLSPGAYTIQLSGKNGATGNALVEAYELAD